MKFPIYDTRYCKPDEQLATIPIRQILGLPWNVGRERAIEGCSFNHDDCLRRLKRNAHKAKETILAAKIYNYAVAILVD